MVEKWVTVDHIIERANRVFPSLEIPRENAAEWCLEVVNDLGFYPGFREKRGVVLEVKNGLAKLPCDVYRVLSTNPNVATPMTSTRRELWMANNDGRYLQFPNKFGSGFPGEVVIDYIAYETDENGWPKIYEQAQEAAMWYIIMRMKSEDFVSGAMLPDRFQWIENNYKQSFDFAKRSTRWSTRQDLDRLVRIARSMIRPAHYAAK